MAPKTKDTLKRLGGILAILLPAVGWALTTAARGVDARYVKQALYDHDRSEDQRRALRDSIERSLLVRKVDSANVRLQQIICGRRVEEGCR